MTARTTANIIMTPSKVRTVNNALLSITLKRERAVKFKALFFWIINLLYSQRQLQHYKIGLYCFVSLLSMTLLQSKKILKLNLIPQALPSSVISYYISKYFNSVLSLTSVDINRKILIPAKIAKHYGLKDYQWISLVSPLPTPHNTTTKRTFLCQILTVEDSVAEKLAQAYMNDTSYLNVNTTPGFITPTALYNLEGESTFLARIKSKSKTQVPYNIQLPLHKPVVKLSKHLRCGFNISFKKAKVVKLARLSSSNTIETHTNAGNTGTTTNDKNMDKVLHKYFEDSKYVSVGDLIPIALKTSLKKRNSFLDDADSEVIYFQVTAIEGEDHSVKESGTGNQTIGNEIDMSMFIYTISVNTTSLYLSENQTIYSCHPPTDKRAILQMRSSSSLSSSHHIDIVPICAPSLQNYVTSLSHWLESFVELRSSLRVSIPIDTSPNPNASSPENVHPSELWPTALITGIVGSGKYTICKTLAQKHGLNFYCVNMALLIGDTSAFTIAKLTSVIHKAEGYSPCILFVKNIHLLGRDKEGQEDKRVILSFTDFLKDINMKSCGSLGNPLNQAGRTFHQQIFIIGSTHETEQIAPMLHDFFIHTTNVQPFRSSSEIVQTLEWLLKFEVDTKEKRIVEESSLFMQVCHEIIISENFDLRQWVENKNVKTVIKYWGDVKTLLAIAIRKAVSCAIVTSSWDNGGGKLEGIVQDHFDSTFLIDPLFITAGASSTCEKIILCESHFTSALESLEMEMRSSVGSPKVPQVSWDDIGGLSNIKSELINSVQLPLKYPHLFTSGLKRSGVLLYGPPGTGKTLVAKAVASEFKINFLSVKGPELLNMYVGQSEKNVREVFDKARDCAPCVLFFDELDSLAPNRGRSGDSGGVMDRVVSQILAEMDGTHSTPGVFIIGATNRPDLIDPALLRPGRFDKLLYVGICTEKEGITSILKALTRKFNLSEGVDMEKLAEQLPIGMSGADVYSFCSEAFMIAITRRIEKLEKGESTDQESTIQVCQDDFFQAMERISTSLSQAEVNKYEEMKTLMR